MLRKLGAYPRQKGLALALRKLGKVRELGKVERTLFLLQYISGVELRRRIHVGLNKGDARNALARAVFFNRLGELRGQAVSDEALARRSPLKWEHINLTGDHHWRKDAGLQTGNYAPSGPAALLNVQFLTIGEVTPCPAERHKRTANDETHDQRNWAVIN